MSELFISSVAFQLSKLHQEDFCNLTLTSVFFFKQHKQPRVFELYWCVIFIYLFIF